MNINSCSAFLPCSPQNVSNAQNVSFSDSACVCECCNPKSIPSGEINLNNSPAALAGRCLANATMQCHTNDVYAYDTDDEFKEVVDSYKNTLISNGISSKAANNCASNLIYSVYDNGYMLKYDN